MTQLLISPNWLPEHKKHIDKNFLEWFIGFSEGDGSFIVSKYKNKNGTTANYERHFFIILRNQKEAQILYNIRTTLGFGTVKKYRNKQQSGKISWNYRYVVSDLDGIKRLINIFAGNLILDKTNKRFKVWVNAYNLRPTTIPISLPDNPQSHIEKNVLGTRNAWLSGFIDAEGCFNCQYNILRIRGGIWDKNISSDWDKSLDPVYKIRLRFLLDQKDETSLFEALQSLFGAGRLDSRKERENMYRYSLEISKTLGPARRRRHETEITSNTKLAFKKLFDYLNDYPLRTTKNIDFVRFKKIWVRLYDSANVSRIDSANLETRRFKRLVNLLNSIGNASAERK